MASSSRGYSKAQMGFFKILRIISSTPPFQQQREEEPFLTKGVGIDLNLRFSTAAESESSRSNNASVTVQTNNNEAAAEEEENEGFPEKSVEVSEEEINNNEVSNQASFQGRDNSNCLDLLIEAARVVSGKEESESGEEKGIGGELQTRRASQVKRKERWVVVDMYGDDVLVEREPVVRSNRGRNQTLPYRFRDSVVEPLKRATRSHRPSSTAQLTKRLLRSSSTT